MGEGYSSDKMVFIFVFNSVNFVIYVIINFGSYEIVVFLVERSVVYESCV